jgi:LmbE family N-acetylglucosaminyl deacetylase
MVKIIPVDWIFLSPHYDDIALSCGGLVWEQGQAGHRTSIWTICAGAPQFASTTPFASSLHARWGVADAVERRRAEDIRSSQVLGAAHRHLPIPDCIYRGSQDPLYPSEESLWGGLHPAEASLVHALYVQLARDLPARAQIVCPLGIGRHVDHQLTRAAAERLSRDLWYYPDYPYVLAEVDFQASLGLQGWSAVRFPVSLAGLDAWTESVAAHASQISSFWKDLDQMRAAIRSYWLAQEGVRLWRRVKDHPSS